MKETRKTMEFSVFSRDDAFSKKLADEIQNRLEAKGWVWNENRPRMVICVGGDGTLLRAIHRYNEILDTTLFAAIHTGTLGFFTDYTKDQVEQLIQDLTEKEYHIWKTHLLEAEIINETGEVHEKFLALNEIRIGSFTSTVAYDVYIDGEFFEHTRGSGICIATQSGSTAVNRALNGAVIDDGLEVLQLCEIMPVEDQHHHSLRSAYVMHPDRTVLVSGTCIPGCILAYDYREKICPEDSTAIRIRLSSKAVRFARYHQASYLERLKHLY